MPDYVLQYVYQLTDFDTSGGNFVPDEQGARAAGNPPFQLQLDATASPLQISVTDNDTDFNEIGAAGQELTNPVTIDGVTYDAGTRILINYVITTDDGFEGFSITIGENNSGNNTTTAFLTNSPMTPGQVYTFTSEGNIGNNSRPYADFACFTNGTLIETEHGAIPVEDLSVGQLLKTSDGAFRPVQLILRRRLCWADLQLVPHLRPVRIVAGALGTGLPQRDLLVSPQHRMLVASPITQRMFAADEVLISAKKLLDVPGIYVDRAVAEIEYFHLVLDQHEVIFAEGAPTESFYCGENAMGALSNDQRAELFCLFPVLKEPENTTVAARPIPAGNRQRKLAERHVKNGKALLSSSVAEKGNASPSDVWQ